MLLCMELAYVMSAMYLIWSAAHFTLYGVSIYVSNISYI